MRPILAPLAAAALISATGVSALPAQQEHEHKAEHAQQQMPDPAAMMAAYVEAAKPGPEHQMLASLTGEYTATVKFWPAPDAPPQVSTHDYSAHMMFDRYLMEEYEGEMLGQMFNGIGLVAFDNVEKHYVSAWIDNMGTGIMTMTGDMDESGRAITMWGKYMDPLTGEMAKTKSVVSLTSDTERTYEMYMVAGDAEIKTMEITLKKQGY